ncbi:DUF4097 family beta strand repeat-containing protein [Acetivibrio saccincola]|uniref:Uncharacterized protein n=1 Tax=Acetivibrio saccincola TaxID=1677857 RepID=A0A2K9E8Y8_9FIRM|nr:DUF4097 family beta strand repeat-containing protein [Acetivibrio saccincola]AUG59008.1 hypothetical protein HVS_15840 [Acetivibrio saccincola]NLW27788.1 DUF4097 family beta strand repeat protein [Acetivibrio saccincola]PQQ65907.1 hypothetical protein B9R14_03420 [Acetivibrio saccincola]HOA98178.1 DUF4097 family beta strand repeat-containing protein [Acetivibrio saccincola]HQD28235.1 DUF4097 family beta strand repeat-containing protein [Acetivibrio saccincola]
MPFSEEKMYILKMLEEGKITSEEAARLLEAIGPDSKSTEYDFLKKKDKKVNFNEEITKVKDKLNDWKNEFKKTYKQKDFDKAVEEFASKMEKVGKGVAYATMGVADKIVDFVGSVVNINAFDIFGNYKAVTKTFEIENVNEDMEIEVEGLNGHILVKKHMDNNIKIRTVIKSPQDNADEILNFSQSDNLVSAKYNKIGNISVSHEIFLPVIKFKKLSLTTKNGKIYVEDVQAGDFKTATSSSSIDLMGVTSDKLSVSNKNGKIQFGYIIGKDIDINTDNSVIEIKHIKTENLNASTRNGRILVENIHHYEGSSIINMNLNTQNSGIKVNMNDMDTRGYKVKAHATNGEINLLIPEMVYKNISKQMKNNFVEAESNGYESFGNKVNIIAEAQNGYIEIIK